MQKIKLIIFIYLHMLSMKTVCIFDVDGTITESGKQIQSEMTDILEKLHKNGIKIVIVGGGTFEKIKWQLRGNPIFDKIYSECGSIYHYNNKLIRERNMMNHCDKQKLNALIKYAIDQILKYNIKYNSQQFEIRKGLVYLSPIGINATDEEREEFMIQDNKYNIRNNLILKLLEYDVDDEFEIVLGGKIGIRLKLWWILIQ